MGSLQRISIATIALISWAFPVATQQADIDARVFRIIAIGCPSNANEAGVLTGFRMTVKGRPGVVTALHGVVGCSKVVAHNGVETISNLTLEQVDVSRDAAFMQGNASALTTSPGSSQLQPVALSPREMTGLVLTVIGYPQGVQKQVDQTLGLHRIPRVTLDSLVPPNAEIWQALNRRRSPSLDTEVFSISGPLQSGYSGAPILNPRGAVVAMGIGGLSGGFGGVNWAIPITDLAWSAARDNQKRLSDLSSLRTDLLFDVRVDGLSLDESAYDAIAEQKRREILSGTRIGVVSLNKEPPPPTALDNEIAYRISQTITRLGALSRQKPADSESKELEQGVRKVVADFVSSDTWLVLNREYQGFTTLQLLAEFRNELRISDDIRSLDLMVAALSNVDTWAAMRRVSFSNPPAVARAFVGEMLSPPRGADAAIRVTSRWRNTDFPYTDCDSERPFC